MTEPRGQVLREPSPKELLRAEWEGIWPFTVGYARIECRGPVSVYVSTRDRRLWPINSYARMYAERYEAEPDVSPIWLVDEVEIERQIRELGMTHAEVGDLRVSLVDVRMRAQEVCGF